MANTDRAESVIDTLRKKLEEDNAFLSDRCRDELVEILKTEKAANSFSDKLTKYLPPFRENPTPFLNSKKIFERPTLDKGLKEKKKGKSDIYCYKDKKSGKNNNNVRCIFIMEDDILCFLLAFVEKSKKDYEKPLEDAVNMYNVI